MDTDQIRQVLRERGWCQICADNHFYNTVGNMTPAGIAKEAERGWELVGIFAWNSEMALVTDASVKPNLTVFRKPAPAFFSSANPWAEKGQLSWLPDLTLGIENDLTQALSKAGGHGSPGIARRFICDCGEQAVTCFYNAEDGRAEAECPSCLDRSKVSDVQQQGLTLQQFACDCGERRVQIDLGIEYPVDATAGWDFSWITVAVTCCSCGKAAILFSAETA